MSVKMKATQYGRSIKAGGWDADGDSGTDAGLGNSGKEMSFRAAALTEKARELLGIDRADHRLLDVDFGNGIVQRRRDEDTAPEDEARIDLLNYWQFNPDWPDYVTVTVVPKQS